MDLSYAYANARIKGMKSNLLDDNVMRELLQVKTLDEITALLEQTAYRQDLVEASKEYEGVQRIDVAVHNNLARTISKVSKILPHKSAKLFESLNAEWDAESFKRILSKKALGLEVSEEDYFSPSKNKGNKSFHEMLAAAKTLGEAMEVIASKWGSARFRNNVRLIAAQTQDLRSAIREIELERARQLAVLAKSADPLTRKIVHLRLAVETAMVILRLKKEGVKKPAEFVVYRNALSTQLLDTEDFDECVKITASAFGLSPETAAKGKTSLSAFEIALEKKTVEKVLSWTRMGVLDFSTAVGFVYLKSVEVSNLRKIAFANAYGLKQELGEFVFAINS